MSNTDPGRADERKRELRRDIRRRRRERLDRGDADARARDAARLAQGFLDLAAELDLDLAAGVALYESLPTEPPTDTLAAALHARGVKVIVPVLLADKDLDWRRLDTAVDHDGTPPPEGDDESAERRHAWGELLGREAVADVGIVVVPALAVDLGGARLGQGGGSYDRALARLGAGTQAVVAVVFDDELIDADVPTDPHDQGVDAVITPNGHRRVRRPSHPG